VTSGERIVPWRDARFAAAFVAAVPVWWLLAPHIGTARAASSLAATVLLYPVLEELCFRGLLQGWLLQRLGHATRAGLSGANLITSLAFAGAHLMAQPPAWALATLLPSLVFGWVRERFGRVLPAIALHAYYNAGLMLSALALR
jgi:hypothetical protein